MRTTAIALSLLLVGPALAQTRRTDAPVFGVATQKCEEATKPENIVGTRAWIAGYLTAFSESFATPSIWMGDPTVVEAIFTETCAAFPKFTLSETAHWIILTLQDRRYNKR